MITYHSLRGANLARVGYFNHTLEGWSVAQWACALAGEVGELCNLVKKDFRRKDAGDTVTRQMLSDEIADIAIYLDLLAARLGIDVAQAVQDKFNSKSREVDSPIRLKLFNEFGRYIAVDYRDDQGIRT